MKRLTTVLATALCGVTLLFAQTDTTEIGMLYYELKEVAVEAQSKITKGDHTLLLPSKEQRRVATSGRDLLKGMHLPQITVNTLTGEISSTAGGEIQLRINGVKATSAEVAGLSPEDIARIEHYQSPGTEFAASEGGKKLDAVINIITRQHDSGGTIQADLLNGMEQKRHSVIDNVGWQHNMGKSAISLGAAFFELYRHNWTRDYSENRTTPDGLATRNETGEAVPMLLRHLSTYLSYSVAHSGKYLFNVKLNNVLDDTPKSEEADRHCTVEASDRTSTITEHLAERSNSPSLDLYYQRNLSDNQTITFDLLGTYIHSNSIRTYTEGTDEYVSDVQGNKYSMIAEGCYKAQTGSHTLIGGLRHLQAYTANQYSGSMSAAVSLRQSESSLYGEYQRSKGNFSFSTSLTVSHLYHSQGSTHMSRWTLQPVISARWVSPKKLTIRYNAGMRTLSPSLAALNDVEQVIAPGEIRRGNSALRAFNILDQRLTFSAEAGSWLSVNLGLTWRHEYKPIMEQVFWLNNSFVRMSQNQRSFDKLTADATITIRPWGEHLTVTLMPEINRYISRMQGHSYTYTLPKFLWSADFVWKRWTLSYQEITGYANYMYGEQLMEERNMHLLMVGCKMNNWHIQIGAMDPFEREYWMETRNFSPLLSSTSRAYTTKPFYVMARLSFRIGYGRKQHAIREQHINNVDNDNGIMQGIR